MDKSPGDGLETASGQFFEVIAFALAQLPDGLRSTAADRPR
jgi:hypothetical protein